MNLNSWSAVSFLALTSFVVTFTAIPSNTWGTAAALSLGAGVCALSLVGAAALLGGRLRFVEALFGGLDRVYVTHKHLGVFALGFASFHLAFKAGLDAWSTASILTFPPFHTRLVRQLSFIALMLIVMLALNRRIPYSVWRWWHKLSGPLFVIIILHWLSFKTPIALASPAGAWLAAWSTLGVGAAAYKLLLYPFLSNHALYRVVAASPGQAAMHLVMAPVKHAIAFTAGQFGFISMQEDGLREPHPFTIASGGTSGEEVHFVIRDLGDYTHKLLKQTTVGMHANIYAPFGRFSRPELSQREVWVAGGVGISPFIAWLTDASARGFEGVTLFYFYTQGREFPSVEKLDKLARRHGAEFVAVSSGASSPEFARRFAEIARTSGPAAVSLSFCGPKGLLSRVKAVMRENGVPDANLRYEHFEFR
jgi:predicted ferric reductase